MLNILLYFVFSPQGMSHSSYIEGQIKFLENPKKKLLQKLRKILKNRKKNLLRLLNLRLSATRGWFSQLH